MALGKLKQVKNSSRRFGAVGSYWFLKTQADYGQEEYWLVTEAERQKFRARAARNPEDTPDRRRGVYTVVENKKRVFGSDVSYFAVEVASPDREREDWFMTAYELERLRERAEKNKEDIDANKEKWLADLLD